MEETFISTMMCILRKNQLITLSTKKDNSHGAASQVATDPNRTTKGMHMEQDIHRWVCKTSTLTRISKVLMVYITIQKGSTFNQPQARSRNNNLYLGGGESKHNKPNNYKVNIFNTSKHKIKRMDTGGNLRMPN